MFGNAEKKIEKMIRKGKWEALTKKYLVADAQKRLILAEQCAKSNDPGVNTILNKLLRDPDERVQLAAVKSLGITGTDHEVAQLQWLLSNTSEDKKELISALHDSISKVRGKR
ncbi:MAG TPA: HEAT repeat domain-containing protein [Ruminiclostridium sp.]|nr:HEAT repeat domain-containing protein [Ruminiclostridium sp.]